MKQLSPSRVSAVKAALFLLCTAPFFRLVWCVWTEQLGANPIEFITRNTGDWTLYFICITLSNTPLRRFTGWSWLIKLRRMLGLFTFFYASLHFTTFLWFDHFFDLGEMFQDVAKRPFILLGFSAFVMLIPLAVTSNQWMIRWLGGRRWQLLHRLVYLIAVLGVVHYWWMKAAKHNLTQPILFAGIVGALLALRLFWAWQKRADLARR